MKLTQRALLLFAVCIATSTLWSQSYSELDPRIQNHYTESEYNAIQAQDPDSVPKIIFYYTQSFTVINNTCTDCIITDLNSIDITKYEHHRLQATRMRVGLTRSYDMLEMLSKDELHQQYLLIENNH